MKGRKILTVLITIGCLVALIVVAMNPADRGGEFLVESYGKLGYRGIVRMLERSGFEVEKVRPTETSNVDVLVVPTPDYGGQPERTVWGRFVERGGLLILGSPSELMGADARFGVVGQKLRRGRCSIGLNRRLDDWLGEDVVQLPDGVDSCFDGGGVGPFFMTTDGEGATLTLASPELLANRQLGRFDSKGEAVPAAEQPDNFGVFAELMARHGARVGFVDPYFEPIERSAVDATMWSFVPSWAIVMLFQALLALVWLAWWASRRTARLVAEPVPVSIAASELVEATGSLFRRRRDPRTSADVIRQSTLRALRGTWGLPPDAPTEQYVYEATRFGIDEDLIRSVADDDATRSVSTEASLLAYAQRCARVRQLAQHTLND